MSEHAWSGNESLSVSVARRVDAACARFERAWKEGSRPRIGDYLEELPEAERPALARELIPLDADYRRGIGEEPRPEDYAARFPDLDADWLARAILPMLGRKLPVTSSPGAGATRTQRLRCPSCHRPIRLAASASEEVRCPGCGSSFYVRDSGQESALQEIHRLGKFQLLEQVGQGAFGVVWKAHDTELDRIVALKTPHPGLLAQEAHRERFLREARAAAQLRHPNLVTVHEVVELEGQSAIVSDFVDGLSLKDVLAGGSLTFQAMAELMVEIVGAVDYAHQMGLVHRDLKPANIMMEYAAVQPTGTDVSPEIPEGESARQGRPLVMDFGLALRHEAEITMTREGIVLGTPAYMSPEQAAGYSHQADARSDVYSLGVILYEMLTGELPFRGSKEMLLRQVRYEEPRPPRKINDKIPRDLETVCLKAMTKAPGRRYASARELAEDLRRWLKGEPIQARPVGRLERMARWVQRNPLVSGLGTTIILVLALGIGISSHLAIEAQSANTKTERVLARSLLRPLGLQNGGTLTDPETNVLWELAENRGKNVWHLFVANALREPVTTHQLYVRAEVALHAAVGLELEKRERVEQLLMERLRDQDIPDRQRLEIALIAAKLKNLKASTRVDVARILLGAIAEKGNEPSLDALTDDLPGVVAFLEPAEARRAASLLTQTLAHSERPARQGGEAAKQLALSLVAVASRLESPEAADILIHAMTHTWNPSARKKLAAGLGAAAPRLNHPEAGRIARTLTQAMITISESHNNSYTLKEFTPALAAVSTRLRPVEAVQIAEVLNQAISKNRDPTALRELAIGLAAVAGRLEPQDVTRCCTAAADALTRAMTMSANDSEKIAAGLVVVATRLQPSVAGYVLTRAYTKSTGRLALREIAAGLVAVAECLEPKEATPIAQIIAEDMTQSDLEQLGQLALALAAMVTRIEPAEASRLCALAVDRFTQHLANINSSYFLEQQNYGLEMFVRPYQRERLSELTHSLVGLVTHLNLKDAAQAADAVAEAIHKANKSALAGLAAELAILAPKLQPLDASRRCAAAVDRLVWVITKTSLDESRIISALAADLAKLAPYLGPNEAAENAAFLAREMSDLDIPSLPGLVSGLAALADRSGSVEATRRCDAAVDALARATTKAKTPIAREELAGALAAVATHFERSVAARHCTLAADAILQAITKEPRTTELPELAAGLAAIAAHLEAPEAARRCAVAGDVLARGLIAEVRAGGIPGATLRGRPRPQAFVSSLATVATFLEPQAIGQTIDTLVPAVHAYRYVREGDNLAAGLAAILVQVNPPELVELLKQPTCAGPVRRVILDQLGHRYRRTFADQWEFVRFAQAQHLGFDFTSPPRRMVFAPRSPGK